ncbi:MAG: hypothetical protein ACRDS0_00835 [Pseudonocardiaceae bacterium]
MTAKILVRTLLAIAMLMSGGLFASARQTLTATPTSLTLAGIATATGEIDALPTYASVAPSVGLPYVSLPAEVIWFRSPALRIATTPDQALIPFANIKENYFLWPL